MSAIRATITATRSETRVLIQDGNSDVLIARLGPLGAAHRGALSTLLESIALWAGESVHAVLFADESADWSRTGLVDRLGIGRETLHFKIELVPIEELRHSHRAKRLQGLGSFARERRVLRRVACP